MERVFIDRQRPSNPPVFVKFTSQLSALRVCQCNSSRDLHADHAQAVNALEGRIFNGNTIIARFFDNDMFDSGVYE